MRYPILLACTSLLMASGAASAAQQPRHVFTTAALPTSVQAQLQERHGDIADSWSRTERTCLVGPLTVGQRLTVARMAPERIEVEIEHARISEQTRVAFEFRDGHWLHAATERFVPLAVQKSAFTALLKKSRTQAAWTPLPTDGTIGVTLPAN